MTVFDDLASTLGTFVGGTAIAGFILGFAVLIVLLIIVALAIGEDVGTVGLFIVSLLSMAFVILVGWWPWWTAMLIVFAFVVIVVLPMLMGKSSGAGGV